VVDHPSVGLRGSTKITEGLLYFFWLRVPLLNDLCITHRFVTRSQAPGMPQYSYYTSFTSHSTEFDYLKSVEIEPRLNKIRWLPISSVRSHSLLSTNGAGFPVNTAFALSSLIDDVRRQNHQNVEDYG
jgi:hypothetical protein